MADTLQDYYNAGHDDDDFWGASTNHYAQTFTTSISYTLNAVKLLLARTFTPSTVTVSIRATSAGKPTGGDLCVETFDGDTLPSGGGNAIWKTITFLSPIVVSSSTKYAIVIKSSDAYILWRHDDSSPTYTDGNLCSSADGSSWSTVSGTDCMFETWGESSAPSKPTTPSPANAATEEDFSALGLSWADGGGADTFNVYMGPVGSLSLISSAQAGTSLTVDIGDVPLNQVIYWRVDATNGAGTTTGDTWNFDARPAQVSVTTPTADASGLTLDATTGSWESPSANTLTYDVNYGTLSGFLSQVENTAELSSVLTPSNYPLYGEIYYWRVDAVNDFGTTQGIELAFTTLIFSPPTPSGVAWTDPGNDPAYTYTGTPTGVNAMIAVRRLIAAANERIWIEDV